MADAPGEKYDLIKLLRTSDLDIRGLAVSNSALSAGDYFFLLTKFLTDSPQLLENLTRITILKDNEKILNNLTEAKGLIKGIGGTKLLPAIDEITENTKKGEKGRAAVCAQKFLDNVHRLCDKIQAAKKRPKTLSQFIVPDEQGGPSETSSEISEKNSLKYALQLLDQEEASRKLRILAVDDAPVTLKIVSSLLGNEYDVYCMSNPKMLEPFLRQVTPELFLLDYKMPELSGFDLIPIIRNFVEHKKTPIIFLTSLGTVTNISTAMSLGACDFMVKPIQASILRDKISKHIVRKKLF